MTWIFQNRQKRKVGQIFQPLNCVIVPLKLLLSVFGEVGAKPWILKSQSSKIRSLVSGKVWGNLGLHEDAVGESQLLLFPHCKTTGSPGNTCHFGFLYNTCWASQEVLEVKNPPANAGDTRNVGLIPGSGRSPRGGHGIPLQCSYLENPMDRGDWQVTVMGSQKVGYD